MDWTITGSAGDILVGFVVGVFARAIVKWVADGAKKSSS